MFKKFAMAFQFNHKKAVHMILFVLHSLGKAADPCRLFMFIYFADLKHLAKYGMLISGDQYMALKNGPAPVHILGIYQKIKEQYELGEPFNKKNDCIGFNDRHQLVALAPYNAAHLSESEAECLYDSVHEHKAKALDQLVSEATGAAWCNADINGEVSLLDMAIESGATLEMIAYIESSFREELYIAK